MSTAAVSWLPERRGLRMFASHSLIATFVFGALRVGSGSMSPATQDTVRGHTAWHGIFLLNAGTLFFKVRDRMESWFDVASLSSLRFTQSLREAGYHAERSFEICPERATYRHGDGDETISVSEPLDDVSFLYFIRTIPLDIGKSYEFRRYFQPAGNPVTVRVLRRERITVPAGTYEAIVIQPEITTDGIFSKKGRAEVWIADDSSRVILQVKSSLSFGSINLYLSGYHKGHSPS